MTKERQTLKAIKDAITHWEQILKVLASVPANDYFNPIIFHRTTDLRMDRDHCPLCQLVDQRSMRLNGYTADCEGCPIYGTTGATYCDDTPFYDVQNSSTFGEAAKQAQREINFLISIEKIYREETPRNKL